MIDAELLIRGIEKFPAIWNVMDNTYRNHECKVRAWREVAKIVLHGYENMPSEKQRKQLLLCKRKWKNIKDYYRKEMKNSKNQNATLNEKRKRTQYFDLLHFLLPSIEEAKIITDANMDDDEPLEIDETDFQEYVDESNDQGATAKRKTKPSHDPTNGDMDEDKAFFYSLLPSVRKLSGRQKIDFRLEILNYIKRIRYPDPPDDFSAQCSYASATQFIPKMSPQSTDSKSDIIDFEDNDIL